MGFDGNSSSTAPVSFNFRPSKWLTSTERTYFHQKLSNCLFSDTRKGNESMWPDMVLNSGPLSLESNAPPNALRGPAGKRNIKNLH